MKKTLLLKTMLLLCALVAGSGTMWADSYEQLTSIADIDESAEYVLGIEETGFHYNGTSSWGKTALPTDKTPYKYTLKKASDGNSFTAKTTISSTTYYLQVPTSNTFSMATSTGTNTDLIIGTTQVSETNYAVANKTTTARHLRINGTSGLRSYAGTTGSMAYFYKVVAETPAYTITAQSNNDNYGTVSLNGSVITATPANGYTYASPAYTVDPDNSATVDQNDNTFTVTPSANTTVTINFEAIPTHTATFSVNGVATTQDFEEGADIIFPENPADVSGKTFVGWATSAIDGTTNDAPEFVTSATMGDADITYYAVFAYASGSGSSDVIKSYGFETESDPDWTITSAIVRTQGEGNTGSYAGKINTNNTYVTFNSKVKVKEFSFAFKRTSTNSNYNVYIETSEDNSTWTADTTYAMSSFNNGSYLTKTRVFDGTKELYVRFHCYNTTAARYVDDVTIKYVGGGISYSDYCTTVVAATVARPTIEVDANPFLFSTTATITCETEDAAIKYSFDGENWNDYNEALTITTATTIYAKAVKDANESSVASVEVTKNLATPTVTVSGDLAVDLEGETNIEAGTLTATVTYNESAVEGATVIWSSNNPDVATIDENTGVVTIKTRGTVTFTATYAGNSDYEGATDKKEITVIDSKAPGSLANPYKVSDITAIENGVYVQGIISSITEVSTQYHNATYKISEDGTTTNEFTVFRGKYLDNANFTSAEQISIGDAVVIYGNIDTYQEQLQLGQGNYLVSLKRKPTAPTFSVAEGEYASTQTVELTAVEGATIYYTLDGTEPTNESTAYNVALVIDETTTVKAIAVKDEMTSDVATATYTITLTPFIAVAEAAIEAEAAGKNGTIEVTYNNFAEVVASVVFCDAEGNDASYDWFTATINENKNVSYSISANAITETRTGYVKVKVGDVYSDIITITQAAFVIDYAELPFGYNGGKDNLPVGLTEFGLGSNYNSSTAPNTQLKFDGNGDSLILKINEAATVLSFDIKGNSFSGGTFTVQTSADGVDYIDLETYTELSESQETFVLDENIRYIKWVYTEKKSGNVGLGNIKVQKHLGNATVTLASACNDGDGKYYGTYSNAAGFVVPADLTVAEVGIDGENKLIVNEYATGDIVAANTGVMVSSETAGDHNIVLSTGGTSLPSVDNRLRATGNEGITAEAMATADDCVYYRLTMHNGTDLGFYWGAKEGAAFAVAANKAYLAVPKAAAARIQGFSFDGGTITGINNLTPAFTQGEGVIFDLQGRSVANPAKGLYIKNGKKVVVK